MNQIILKGNTGQDPEVKVFDWGKVAKFSLATSEGYTNKQGEKVTETDWHNIVFRGKQAETIEKYVKKGDQLLITGKVKYRSYEDKEGRTVYITEIIGERFEFCGTKEKPKEEKSGPQYESGYSDINDLPSHIQEQQEISADDNNPF